MLLMLGPIVVTGLHLYFPLEEVEKVILIEPNEDRINDLKKRSEMKKVKIIQVALDYREDNLNLVFKRRTYTCEFILYLPQRNAENICVQKTKTTSR